MAKKTKKRGKLAEVAANQILGTQREAAQYIGKSMRTIRRWLNEGMLTVTIDGKRYYLKEQLNFFKNAEGKLPTDAKLESQTADSKYKQAKARLMQMELELKQGKLVPIENIEAGRIRRILAVKRALLGLGRKMAPQLAKIKDERKIAAVINAETRDMIEGFASP